MGISILTSEMEKDPVGPSQVQVLSVFPISSLYKTDFVQPPRVLRGRFKQLLIREGRLCRNKGGKVKKRWCRNGAGSRFQDIYCLVSKLSLTLLQSHGLGTQSQCAGTTQRDGMGREVGEGFRTGGHIELTKIGKQSLTLQCTQHTTHTHTHMYVHTQSEGQ